MLIIDIISKRAEDFFFISIISPIVSATTDHIHVHARMDSSFFTPHPNPCRRA